MRAARAATQALDHAARAGETALAAAQVIDARSRLIGAALVDPAKLSDPELMTMVTEKVDAALAAGNALSRNMPAALRAGQLWLSRQQRIAAAVAHSATRRRAPLDLVGLWSRLGWRGLEAFHSAACDATQVGIRAAGAGLAPIHRTATRNAKRLKRKR